MMVAILAACEARAQDLTIKGTVRDESGVGVSGVKVTFWNEANSYSLSAATAHDGSYTLAPVKTGTYRVEVKVVKNKVAPPFRQAEFDIMFDEGISHAALLVDLAAEVGVIEKSGAWYGYAGQRIGQGRENTKLFLKDNPTLMAEIEQKVKDALGMKAVTPVEEEGVAEE